MPKNPLQRFPRTPDPRRSFWDGDVVSPEPPPPPVPIPPGRLMGWQGLGIGLGIVLNLTLSGGVGLFWPLLGGLIGTVWYARHTLTHPPPGHQGWDRTTLITAGKSAFILYFIVGCLGYIGLYGYNPALYPFGPATLIWAAPVMGLLLGGCGLGTTICGLDLGRTWWGNPS